MSDHSLESSRILIVSREASVLNLLSAIGKANGWQLETANSGWEALERVEAGTAPGAIILDMGQDEGEGLHTLRWLRRVRPDMHVLLLSHSGNAEQKMEAMRLGAEEYLVYPLKEQQLEVAIRRSLSDEGSSDPGEEIEQIADDQFFVAAGVAMRKLRAQLEPGQQAQVVAIPLPRERVGMVVGHISCLQGHKRSMSENRARATARFRLFS